MRYIITFFLALSISNCALGQWEYTIDFDSPSWVNNKIIIDTSSNSNNVWQIGIPDKSIFNSSRTPYHAIVTDSLNPYPSNDTSSFILKHIRPGNLGGNQSLQLNFWYRMNSDTLTDYGKVEASVDNGISWIDLMIEDTTYYLYWLDPKPTLTGNSKRWQHFALELQNLTDQLGYSDTLLYRFTFISDSIQTYKDGWMIDDFQLADWWEGINDDINNNIISIYPNPSNGEFSIKFNGIKSHEYQLEIIDLNGTILLKEKINNSKLKFELPGGLYILRISDKENIFTKKMFIEI